MSCLTSSVINFLIFWLAFHMQTSNLAYLILHLEKSHHPETLKPCNTHMQSFTSLTRHLLLYLCLALIVMYCQSTEHEPTTIVFESLTCTPAMYLIFKKWVHLLVYTSCYLKYSLLERLKNSNTPPQTQLYISTLFFML